MRTHTSNAPTLNFVLFVNAIKKIPTRKTRTYGEVDGGGDVAADVELIIDGGATAQDGYFFVKTGVNNLVLNLAGKKKK